MSLPKPPASLDDSCTVIHGNTLYSYNAEAFLSLELEEGAEWKELDNGEKVTGGVCVGTTPGDDSQAALFIVGGTGGSDDYTGLQKFTYSTGEWTTITPSVQVTKNRRWHGSTYLQANDAIVVYAGSTDGVEAPGTETFTIQASEPYQANAYGSCPHAVANPVLLDWSAADAVLVGGDSTSTSVSLFNPAAGWRESGATLATPLAASDAVRAIIVAGDDGSKSLYTFDLAQSPNAVSRFVLQDASGAPVYNSAAVSNTKRDLTLDDWPEYNSTLAPTAARQNAAVAQGSDGTVVFSGGNDDEPLSIFNAAENSWVDSSALFSGGDQKVLSDTTSSSDSSSAATSTSSSSKKTSSSKTSTEVSSTSEASASETATSDSSSSTFLSSIASSTASATSETSAIGTTGAAAAGTSGSGSSSGLGANAILGITLGSIIAFLALLGFLLFCIRRRKASQNHAEAGHARRASGAAPDEKDPSAFGVNTLPPPSPGHYRGHQARPSTDSVSSMAILMGRLGAQKSNAARQPSQDTHRSSVSSLHKQFKSTISKPIPQETQHPALQGHDDKGVAFDPTVAEPRQRNGPLEANDGTRRSSGWNRYWSGGSSLQILGFGAPKRGTVASDLSSQYSEAAPPYNPRVTQDSATVPPLNFEGRPEVNRVNSGSPVVAQYGSQIPFKDGMSGKIERPSSRDSSGYSSGIPESIADAWDPNEAGKPWGSNRAPSSAYTPSFYYGTPLAPSAAGARQTQGTGVSTQPQLAKASTSDMSWLNLGDQNRV